MKIGRSKLTSISETILMPTCLNFPSQNPSKSHQKSILKSIDFCIDLLSSFYRLLKGLPPILGPTLDPCWLFFRHETAPKTRPRAQDTENAPRTPLGGLQTSILVPPDLDFGAPRHRFFKDFSIDFPSIFQLIFR